MEKIGQMLMLSVEFYIIKIEQLKSLTPNLCKLYGSVNMIANTLLVNTLSQRFSEIIDLLHICPRSDAKFESMHKIYVTNEIMYYSCNTSQLKSSTEQITWPGCPGGKFPVCTILFLSVLSQRP